MVATTGLVESRVHAPWFRHIHLLVGDQRVVFVVVGLFNTVAGFALFTLFQVLVGVHFGYMWSLLLAHVTSVLVAFVAHRRVTFKVRGKVLGDLVRFESVYLVGLALNAVLLPLLVEVAELNVIAAQACVTAVTAFLSWLGHSRMTFRRGRRP